MSTNYPANYDNYASRTDGVDTVMASHMNDAQDAISSIEHELGLNPKGPYSSVGAAVAAMLDANTGGTLHGNVACDPGVTIDGVDISELSGSAKKGSFWNHNAVNRSRLDANSLPDYLVPGSGLSVDILVIKNGTPIPVEMDVAGYYQKVASATTIPDLTASTTCYLYAEKGATDIPLFGHSTIKPKYSSYPPGSPASGLHWIDMAAGDMKRYNGTDWIPVKRIFIGEALTNASCTSVINYALRGFHDTGWFDVAANTAYTKDHNIGTYPIDVELFGATDSDGTQNVHRVVYFKDGGNGYGGIVGSITELSCRVNHTSGFDNPIFYGAGSASSGYYRLLAKKGW